MWTQYLALAAAAASFAAWQERPHSETQTFRVTAERIQFEALFLDGQNRPVVDIGPDEVTVTQESVVVPLADFRFHSRTGPRVATSQGAMYGASGAASARGDAAQPSEVDADAWIFLIDDLVMSPDGFARAKSGLLATLERNVPPGVVVGILRTGILGTHQTRLSDDRTELLRALSDMRYKGNRWRGGVASRSGATAAGPNSEDRVFVEGTLGSLNSLLLSLRPLAGRKVVVVLSEMIALTASEGDISGPGGMPNIVWNVAYDGVAQRLRRLGKLASDAGVTVHTVDLAGVTGAGSYARVMQDEGLHAVADELGGLYFGRSNDAGALLGRVAAAEQGHYVLAYEPPAGTFDDGGKPRFVEVSVAVSRPGVTVRTRKGFFTR